MTGRLIAAWRRSWSEIWLPLSKSSIAPQDLFRELVQELIPEPTPPEPPPAPSQDALDENGELVDPSAISVRKNYEAALLHYQNTRATYETAAAGDTSKEYFRTFISRIDQEIAAVRLLEDAYEAIELFGRANLTARYRQLVQQFIQRYSIRYELREPMSLHATLPGLFSQMMSDLKELSSSDGHLSDLYEEFEEALSDLRQHQSSMRIKTCLQKQFNLMEAFAARTPGVTAQTLGAMCDQLDWPHATIKEVGKKLYGFRSNYPGLGHAGNAQGVIRQITMKDFLSLSLMLASFMPYVAHSLNPEHCYTAG